MRRSLLSFAASFAVVAIPLGVLAAAGTAVVLGRLDADREAAIGRSLHVLRVLVSETDQALRREASVLARDPALAESAARGDWVALAGSGAPRITALVRDGGADLVAVRDGAGVPLIQ